MQAIGIMEIYMKNKNFELNEIVELIGLLYFSYDINSRREQQIEALDKSGYSGKDLYREYFDVREQYIDVFDKYKITNDFYNFFFSDIAQEFLIFLIIILNQQPLGILKTYTEPELKKLIIASVNSLISQNNEKDSLFSILENSASNLSYHEKWKLLSLYESPKKYIYPLIELIELNINSFYQSVDYIKIDLNNYIKDLKKRKENDDNIIKNVISKRNTHNLTIFPTLIFSVSILFINDNVYYGLLLNNVLFSNHNTDLSYLLNQIKALSDKSKLLILLSLKKNPKYNLEIANELGLSPGTMSHHMNILLISNFVQIEKKDKRTYYVINKDGIINFINSLQKTLL